jgi:hypothetical protein
MDKLDTAIENKRKERADLQRQLDVVTIELRALEEAAALRPIDVVGFTAVPVKPVMRLADGDEPKRGGREPGCISKKWRVALRDLARRSNPYRTTDEIYLVTRTRVRASLPAVKERVRSYVAMGFMEESEGRYRVTQHAIEKFDLDLTVREDPAFETGPSHLNGAEAPA